MSSCEKKFNLLNHIIGGLDKLEAYKGIKAFAFKNIWSHDQNRQNELKEKLKVIASRIPLYRCKKDIMSNNKTKCTLCGEPGSNTEINKACLTD